MPRACLFLVLAASLGCGVAPPPESAADAALSVDPFAGRRWVDLTHVYNADNVFWPTGKPFQHVETAYGDTPGGWFYSSYDFSTSEHSGTHLDAPIHFSAGKATVDRLSIGSMAGPAVVIDVTDKVSSETDYLVSPADIEAAEAADGPIEAGSIVLIRTDWSTRWPDTKAYLGDDRPGKTDDLHFPGLAPETASLLVERGVKAVGIDTASIDYGPTTDFKVHQILAGRNIPILENLTELAQLPARGAHVIALPMKIGDGSGGPCRVAALVPDAAP